MKFRCRRVYTPFKRSTARGNSWLRRGILNSPALTPILVVLAVAFLAYAAYDKALPGSSTTSAPRGTEPDIANRNGTQAIMDPIAGDNSASEADTKSPGTLVDVAASVGLDFAHDNGAKGLFYLPEQIGSGAAFFDYDNDGDLDVFFAQGRALTDGDAKPSRLFRNDEGVRFVDVTASCGINMQFYAVGCAAADYDNDGDVDLYVTCVGANSLWRNNGDGTFTDAAVGAGVADGALSACAVFFDFDRDGWLDLFVGNYARWSLQADPTCYNAAGLPDYCTPEYYDPTPNRLFRNLGNGRFEDVLPRSRIEPTRTLGVACTDLDGDGWLDLFVTNDMGPAQALLNRGTGIFHDAAREFMLAYDGNGDALSATAVLAADLDGDGDDDLLVTTDRAQFVHAWRNDGNGVWRETTFDWALPYWTSRRGTFGLAVFDRDLDGSPDVFLGHGERRALPEPARTDAPYAQQNQLFRLQSDGVLVNDDAAGGPSMKLVESTRAVLSADYDNDGDVDLLLTNSAGPARLLRNDTPLSNAWTQLELQTGDPGRTAIGARVSIEAGGRAWVRSVMPQSGYLSSNDPRICLGIGQADKIDSLSILWPDGSDERWQNLPVRSRLLLKQGASPSWEEQRGMTKGGRR